MQTGFDKEVKLSSGQPEHRTGTDKELAVQVKVSMSARGHGPNSEMTSQSHSLAGL